MIKYFAVSVSILLTSFAYSNDIIRYYNGKLKLATAEVDSICNQIIKENSGGYLLALAHYQKGVILRKRRKNLEAYDHYDKALILLQNTDTVDSYLHSAILRNQGVILKYHGLHKEAVSKHEEALVPAYSYSVSRGLSIKYNLGWSLSNLDPEKALQVFLELLGEAEEEKDTNRQTKALNEIALIMLRSEEFDSAIEYLGRAEKLAENKEVRAFTYQNWAHVYAEQDEIESQEAWLKKSIELGTHKYLFISLMDMGVCVLRKGDIEGAKYYLLEAEKQYAEQPLALDNIVLFEHLASVFPENNDYLRKLADEYKHLAEEKGMLEKMIKQQAMAQLLLRLEQAKRTQKRISRYQILAITCGAMALIILLTWRVWWYRLRKRLGKKILHMVSRWETEEEG